jgi:putative transposase
MPPAFAGDRLQRSQPSVVNGRINKIKAPLGATHSDRIAIAKANLMANTYTQIYIHIVFAVQGRSNVIRRSWKDKLEPFITGIVQNRGHKLIIINYQPDHVHMLIGLNPNQALSDLMRDVKSSSSKHINEQRWLLGQFHWQEGYGAFSCSRSTLPKVIRYIESQTEHHGRKTFGMEFRSLLQKYDVTYEEAYIFDNIEMEAIRDAEVN